MAPRWFILATNLLLVSACGAPDQSPPPSVAPPVSAAGQPIRIDPANIRRLRGVFPAGYEVAPVDPAASPAKFWGMRPGWSTDPSPCAMLADPAAGNQMGIQGFSGSGDAGVIHVVVAALPGGPDPGVVEQCAHWSMDSGRTTAVVDRFQPAAIEGVTTIGMLTATRTVVEGGSETDARATTVTAYLGDYVTFVTVVTDPGINGPQFSPDFASNFLVRAVATLRG